MYTVDQINAFLDKTKGKSVEVGDFFPDLDKFVASVMWARKVSSDTKLSQQKHYRLKKHITAVRKGKGKPKKGKNNYSLWVINILFFLTFFFLILLFPMEIFRVGSLNVNGMRDKKKAETILELIKLKNLDAFFLQGTQ
ncbi:MAG: hypothetical protein ACRCZO_19685 [Cetobacterium sp.]